MNITTTFTFDNWEEFQAFTAKLDGATLKKSKTQTTATVGPDAAAKAESGAAIETKPPETTAIPVEDVDKERERIRKIQKKYTQNPPDGLGMIDQVRAILKSLGASTVSTLDPSKFKEYEEKLLSLG